MGCTEDIISYNNTPEGNFEALWQILDDNYCFFDYKKKTINLDWNKVYLKYKPMINDKLTREQLFEVLGNMIAELQDGHVNLYSGFDMARYWAWKENYPANYSDSLIRKYLGTDYKIASGLKYKMLDDNIGYIKCESFSTSIGYGALEEIMLSLASCNALIIDIRNNGGGMITAAETLASRFTNKKIFIGYIQHKRGKEHNNFSPMKKQMLKPAKGIRWQKQTAVLTNRGVFSAANDFVKLMKCCPNVIVVGDKTGGGAGLPFSRELPNGWNVRFSACPVYNVKGETTEHGISPDYKVDLTNADLKKGRDTIIEFARKLLK